MVFLITEISYSILNNMAFIILSQLSRECGIFLSTELPGFAKWVPLSLHILKQGIHVCGGGWSIGELISQRLCSAVLHTGPEERNPGVCENIPIPPSQVVRRVETIHLCLPTTFILAIP